MQVFDETADGPVFTLDAANNQITFSDFVGDLCGFDCPAVPLYTYEGRTTLHSLNITFGPTGTLNYFVSDAISGDEIVQYNAPNAQFGTNAT